MECSNPTKAYPRVTSIDDGVVMVVTDLHGDWPLYQRYRDIFLNLRAQGLADTLLLTGDYIHSEGPAHNDRSIDIVLDLLALRDELGPNLVVLLGNHEMPHIYPYVLAKGDYMFTPRFEHAMGPYREMIVEFFDSLPFYARTRAGVTLCHTGAFPKAQETEAMKQLFTYSHQHLLTEVRELIGPNLDAFRIEMDDALDVGYDRMVEICFGVTGPDDPRYYDYLIAEVAMAYRAFDVLWDAVTNDNEREYAMAAYKVYSKALLNQLSDGYTQQTVLVTGHMSCTNGYHIVANGQQLRLASGTHAKPYATAKYLLFDARKSVRSAEQLKHGLGSVFNKAF